MKKISDKEKEIILHKYTSGEKVTQLSTEYGVSKSTIYLWINQSQNRIINKCDFSAADFKKLKQKCERLEKIVQILQSTPCTPTSSLREKLSFLEQIYEKEHNVHLICEAMCVPRGTFYNHILRGKRGNTEAKKRNDELLPIIEKVFSDSNQIYGAGKVTAVLNSMGYIVSEKVVARIMHEHGMFSIIKGAKTQYQQMREKRKNLIKQNFKAFRPNEIWVSDVTYFHLKKKRYYICVIIDLFARKVVGYSISIKNSTQLTKNTFKKAYTERELGSGLIFHSDNGSNYTSKTFSSYLRSLDVSQSFSKAGVPYDNSVCESFFKNMKTEELYRKDYTSENHFRRSVDKYIEFYNTQRPHSVIQYQTPDKYEERYYAKNSKK